jgi:hypothetical protein
VLGRCCSAAAVRAPCGPYSCGARHADADCRCAVASRDGAAAALGARPLRGLCCTPVRLRLAARRSRGLPQPRATCGCGARRAPAAGPLRHARAAAACGSPLARTAVAARDVLLRRAARARCGAPAARPCGCSARRAARADCRTLARRASAARGARPLRGPCGTPVRLQRAARRLCGLP